MDLPSRPFEGRLTGGFAHAPYDPSKPEGETADTLSKLQLKALEVLEQERSPQALADLAVLKLYSGKPGDAVALLREAVAQEPRNGRYLSDLGAALSSLAEIRLRSGEAAALEDLLGALDAAEKALKSEPSLTEALFNRALAMERLHLRTDALQEWQRLIRLEGGSQWDIEAQRRVEVLLRPSVKEQWVQAKRDLRRAAMKGDQTIIDDIVEKNIQGSRVLVQEELLGEWAKHYIAGDVKASRLALRLSKSIAGKLATLTSSDNILRDTISHIESIESPNSLRSLARGFVQFQAGVNHFNADDFGLSRSFFAAADELLSEERSPFSGWASYFAAVSIIYSGDYDQAREELGRIRLEETKECSALQGRILWSKGVTYFRQSDFAAAERHYRAALKCFEVLEERENTTSLVTLVSEACDYLGDIDRSRVHLMRALQERDQLIDPRRVHSLLFDLAEAALDEGYLHVALRFQTELARVAREEGTSLALLEAFARRAKTYHLMGDPSRALGDLLRAHSLRNLYRDVASISADLSMIEGQITEGVDRTRALDALEETLALIKSTGFAVDVADVYLSRARILLSLKRPQEAIRSLEEGVAAIEEQSSLIPDLERALYSDRGVEIYDEMIGLQLNLGRPEAALVIAERAMVHVQSHSAHPIASDQFVESIRTFLPADAALVVYRVLRDRLVVWCITKEELVSREVPVSRDDLVSLVQGYGDALQRSATESGPQTPLERRAYEVLLGHIAEPLADKARLVVVPDKTLSALSFAALKGPDGKFLVERHAVSVAPSIQLLRETMGREGDTRQGALNSILIVTPEGATETAENLESLPNTQEEASSIAGSFPGGSWKILKGDDATPRNLSKYIDHYSVLHYAGHSLSNGRYPLLSNLVLAADGSQGGVLYAHEIRNWRLKNLDLVVLASCGSARKRAPGRGHDGSLAHAFLSAGARVAIGSLWDVEDGVSSVLFQEFYRGVRDGLSPAEALRSAQLMMVKSERSSFREAGSWASFQVYGAVL